MRGALKKLQAVWKRRQLERDLEDELAFHLAMREEKNRQAGVTESARRSFGNPELVKEDLRDQWTFRAVENFWRDLRYAARMLRQSPGFTLVAVLSLAIGIGGNTAIFSVVDAILLKSLPVRDPDQLRVVLSNVRPPVDSFDGYSTNNSGWSSFPYPVYEQFVHDVPEFLEVMGFAGTDVTVIAGAQSHYAASVLVTGNFFSGLGVTALGGRILTPEDDHTGAAPVVVISYRYWERHLGLEPEAVGRTIFMNGRPVTIVGILPRAFVGVRPGGAPDLYLPMALVGAAGNKWYRLEDANTAWVQIIGRLRPGTSDQQTMAGLGVVMQRASVAAERTHGKQGAPWRPVLQNGARGIQLLRDEATPALLVLSSVVGLVLLIACANLANLLLARGVARRREIAVRLSIGAGRWRLMRQLLTESLLLAGLGAGIGLALAAPLSKFVVGVAGGGDTIDAHLDGLALLFTGAAALATALLFGLLPAIRATRVDLTPALKEGSGGALGSDPRLRVSRLLIAGQVALSTLLLTGAGLFVRTLANITSIDPGFQTQRLLLFDVDGLHSGYEGERLLGLYERIREKVAAIPGVRAVTLSNHALISGTVSNDGVSIPGYHATNGQQPVAYLMRVGNDFLTSMEIPIVQGRDLDSRDRLKAPRVAVVNETFVRMYFAGQSAMGRIFQFGNGKHLELEPTFEVVGVCKDAKYSDLKDKTPPTVYLSYLQEPNHVMGMTFEVRTAMPPMAIAGAVQKAVATIDRNVPVADMRTQEEQIRETFAGERMFAGVVSSFGAIAALLAAIGLYGVTAYAVTRRTNEIGIRLALGAGRGDVQWMVLRESLWMVAAGLVIGIPAALALTKLVQQALYGIRPNDPVSFFTAGVLMVAVAAVAAWIPARRAARVDPMRALRFE
jgi:macrolide transport system ATP-binding/permease protein